jgi:hypothetical protein
VKDWFQSFLAWKFNLYRYTVAAEVWRGGAKLLSIAGTLDRKPDDTEKKTIFPGTENVFLNIQTNQPLWGCTS